MDGSFLTRTPISSETVLAIIEKIKENQEDEQKLATQIEKLDLILSSELESSGFEGAIEVIEETDCFGVLEGILM
jgi:hypothetical protein